MSSPEERIAELGLTLPSDTPPLAAYVPAVRTGNLVFTSGQLPRLDGELSHGRQLALVEGFLLSEELVCLLDRGGADRTPSGEHLSDDETRPLIVRVRPLGEQRPRVNQYGRLRLYGFCLLGHRPSHLRPTDRQFDHCSAW